MWVSIQRVGLYEDHHDKLKLSKHPFGPDFNVEDPTYEDLTPPALRGKPPFFMGHAAQLLGLTTQIMGAVFAGGVFKEVIGFAGPLSWTINAWIKPIIDAMKAPCDAILALIKPLMQYQIAGWLAKVVYSEGKRGEAVRKYMDGYGQFWNLHNLAKDEIIDFLQQKRAITDGLIDTQ